MRDRRAYVAYTAVAAGAFVVASMIVLVIVRLSGDGNDAERIDFSDFGGGLLELGGIDNRRFHATCPPGRLTVEFSPDHELRITREEGTFVASLRAEEASVACPGALEDPRGKGFHIRGIRSSPRREAKLECLIDQRIYVDVHPIFRGDTDVYGGSLVVSTPARNLPPKTVVGASFHEDGTSDLWYRPARCSISQS